MRRGRVASARGGHEASHDLLERSLAALEHTDYRLERLRIMIELVPMLVRVARHREATALTSGALRQARAIGAHAFVRKLEGAP